jgi:anti-anti-sigma regulatory factor
MLRITSHLTPDEHVLQLEGCVSGPWVRELARSWGLAMTAARRPRVVVDLEDVGYVDDAGCELLAAMQREGVCFKASGFAMRELVGEISGAAARSPRS